MFVNINSMEVLFPEGISIRRVCFIFDLLAAGIAGYIKNTLDVVLSPAAMNI